VVTSVIASEGNGRWIEDAGGYTDMLAQRAAASCVCPGQKLAASTNPGRLRGAAGHQAACE
jgi:ABC transport system ATP-binding/permease protein